MALKPPAGKKPSPGATEAEIDRVIQGGNATSGDKTPTAVPPQSVLGKDVTFTMTIPPGLAAQIDAHRGPTKTSRRSWLLQAAEERLKREGMV